MTTRTTTITLTMPWEQDFLMEVALRTAMQEYWATSIRMLNYGYGSRQQPYYAARIDFAADIMLQVREQTKQDY